MRYLKMLALVAVALVAVLGFSACGNSLPTSPEEPEVMVQRVSLLGLTPPVGSTLYSGQTLTAEVIFSFPRAAYPLQADLTFWTVIPGSPGWHQFGEGRGCVDTAYKTYSSKNTMRCELYLHPIIWGWWQRDGVKKVVLAFRAKNAKRPGYGIGNELAYQEFDIDYRVP